MDTLWILYGYFLQAHLDCGTQLDAEKATAAKLREKRQKRVAARKAAEALESGRAEADRSLDASADDATATPVDLDERDPETDRSAPPMLTVASLASVALQIQICHVSRETGLEALSSERSRVLSWRATRYSRRCVPWNSTIYMVPLSPY